MLHERFLEIKKLTLFFFGCYYSDFSFVAVRGMRSDSEPNLRFGGSVVVGELAALPSRRGSRLERRADHPNHLRSRRQWPGPTPQGLRHPPRVQGRVQLGRIHSPHPAASQDSVPCQAIPIPSQQAQTQRQRRQQGNNRVGSC